MLRFTGRDRAQWHLLRTQLHTLIFGSCISAADSQKYLIHQQGIGCKAPRSDDWVV